MQAKHAGDNHLPSPDPNKEELKTTRAVCQSHSTRSVLREVSAGLKGTLSQLSRAGPGTICSLPESLRTLTTVSYLWPQDKWNGKDRIVTLRLKVTYKYLGHTSGKGMPGGHLSYPEKGKQISL